MFWDASAIIPLCVEEPRTRQMKGVARGDKAMAAWWGSLVECSSAFARLRREEVIISREEEELRELLDLLASAWTEIKPVEEVRNIARRLLRVHPLRAADSLQLAAALVWVERNPQGEGFVCLDQRLREAALKEGFRLVPEG